MRTKCINIKSSVKNRGALNSISFYSNSPYWQFFLCKWIEDCESTSDTIAYTDFNYFDEEKREKEVDDLCNEMQKIGMEFTRTLIQIVKY